MKVLYAYVLCTYCPEIEAKIVACLLRAFASQVPSFSLFLYSYLGRRGSLRPSPNLMGGSIA